MWFALWSVLVVGTLVGAFLLVRRLWRSLVSLGRELARAGEVTSELADRAAELADLGAQRRASTDPTLFADRDELRDAVRGLRRERAHRREERARRHAEVARGWRTYWT